MITIWIFLKLENILFISLKVTRVIIIAYIDTMKKVIYGISSKKIYPSLLYHHIMVS